MISISTTSCAYNGNLILKEKLNSSSYRKISSRLSRKTDLNNAMTLQKDGFYEAERTFDFTCKGDESQAQLLQAAVRSQLYFTISCLDGFYLGIIQQCDYKNSEISFSFWVEEKLA